MNMWNEAKSNELVKTYKVTNHDLDQTAAKLGISVPSARGKLVALGEYRVKNPKELTTRTGINKEQYINAAEAILGLRSGQLNGLDKASGKTIQTLVDAMVKMGDKA